MIASFTARERIADSRFFKFIHIAETIASPNGALALDV